MFVKVVRREGTKGGAGVSLFECNVAHMRPGDALENCPGGHSVIVMQPSDITLDVFYDKDGAADCDVFYMNNDGQTIDKVA